MSTWTLLIGTICTRRLPVKFILQAQIRYVLFIPWVGSNFSGVNSSRVLCLRKWRQLLPAQVFMVGCL